jgi:hypothetical protein
MMTRYHVLIIKCLKEEIKAFLTYEEKTAKLKEEARSWIFDDEYNKGGEFSCRRICEALNEKIGTLRVNVMFAEKKGWTLDQYMSYSLYGHEPEEKPNDKDKPIKAKTSNKGSKGKSKRKRKVRRKVQNNSGKKRNSS